jgi:hypothetical protein
VFGFLYGTAKLCSKMGATLEKYLPLSRILYALIFCRTECYDYLFDLAVQMKLHGLNPQDTPEQHELRIQNESAVLRNGK